PIRARYSGRVAAQPSNPFFPVRLRCSVSPCHTVISASSVPSNHPVTISRRTLHFVEDTMSLPQIAKDTCIVRNTAAKKGRTTAVAPGTAASRYLHYGRIILDAGDAPLKFDTKNMETALIGLKGSATV